MTNPLMPLSSLRYGSIPRMNQLTVIRPHFAPDRRVACQHRACILQEIFVLEPARQIVKRPADIGGDEVEQRLGSRREETDVELGIQREVSPRPC